MRPYEVMVIFDPDTEERSVQPTLEQYLTVITKGGGTVENLDIWGRRRLAYEIRKKSEGIYAVINLTAEPDDVKELDRQFTDQRVDHADQGHPARHPLRSSSARHCQWPLTGWHRTPHRLIQRRHTWQAKPSSPWSAT